MRSSFLIYILLSSIIPSILAQTSLSTVIGSCITKLGRKSVSLVPTKSSTKKATFSTRITTTSTQSVTTIASPVTSTSTVISINIVGVTANIVTDYYTSTSTSYSTSTTTITTSITTTSTAVTSTTTQNTISIPTSNGFVPVASGFGYPGAKKKRIANNRLNVAARQAATSGSVIKALGGSISGTPTQYPIAVTCDITINAYVTNVVSKTAKSTITVTAVPTTRIIFATTIVTTTTTIYPLDAKVTTIVVNEIAVTASTTMTQTTTVSTTNTYTVAAPDATYWAACASNNVVNTVAGGTFDSLQVSGSVQPAYFSNTPDAYTCCVACQTTTNCAGSAFADGMCTVYPVGGSDGTSGGTCSPNSYFADFFQSGFGDPWTISNGICGQYVYGQGACIIDAGGSC